MNPTCFQSSPTTARPHSLLLIITGAQGRCRFHIESHISHLHFLPFLLILQVRSAVFGFSWHQIYTSQLVSCCLLISFLPVEIPGAGEIRRTPGCLFVVQYSWLPTLPSQPSPSLYILVPQVWSFVSVWLCLHY